jgi:hypothetical protein
MKNFFIALLLLTNIYSLNAMDIATPASATKLAHPILQALAAHEKLKFMQMERYVECRVKEVGADGLVERTSNQSLYALIYALPWPMSHKGSLFFQIKTNDLYTPHDKDLLSSLHCFNYSGEWMEANPIEALVSFIRDIRDLQKLPEWPKEKSPKWAQKTAVKEWRKNHQREFLESLSKPQRNEIKRFSHLAQYAACFLYELRQKRMKLMAQIVEKK